MNNNEQVQFIEESRALYRHTLLQGVVPFWMRYGFDREYGGIGNILDDAGNTLGHDKYLWSQGRALWTFSALYNRIEPRVEWLDFAGHIYNYLATHGRDEQGRWMYRLDPEGNVVERDTSIAVDGFVLNGMGEYYVASGERDALRMALETCENTHARLQKPGSYGIAPYELPPGLKAHGIAMLFALNYFNLGKVAERADICESGLRLAHEVLSDFYVRDKDAILEFVALDGSFVDSPAGRACVPGHAVESLWFLISIFEETGDAKSIDLCCRLIRRHLELGWDEEYGGLRLALDIDGQTPLYWQRADCKPWWVQLEALVATAYAFRHTGEDWCLQWHRRVQQWAFARYPQPSGEWTQWFDATGQIIENAVLPVKDPFHLPRALIYLLDVFQHPPGQVHVE